MEGRKLFASLKAPTEPPEWLDKESCRKGREFYWKNSSAIALSNMEALLLGMCIPNFYKPLVISKKSHFQEDSRKRYLETAALVYSWYLDDCWDSESVASKEIRTVNNMHRFVADKVRPINGTLSESVRKVFEDSEINCEAELSGQDHILLSDIAAIREHTEIPEEYYDYVNDSNPFSQTDMAIVQGAFFGHYLQFPEHYGGKGVTHEDVQDFLMFWRTNGYYLGIDDKFNAVLDDLDETKIFAELVMEKILKPCMLHLNPESMHMAKAALFPFMDYHVTVYVAYELVGYNLVNLWKSFSITQKMKYYLRQIYVPHIYPIPFIKTVVNKFAVRTLENILHTYRKRGFTKKIAKIG